MCIFPCCYLNRNHGSGDIDARNKCLSAVVLYGWQLQTDTCWSCSATVNGTVPAYSFAEWGPAYRNVSYFGGFACTCLHIVQAHVSWSLPNSSLKSGPQNVKGSPLSCKRWKPCCLGWIPASILVCSGRWWRFSCDGSWTGCPFTADKAKSICLDFAVG